MKRRNYQGIWIKSFWLIFFFGTIRVKMDGYGMESQCLFQGSSFGGIDFKLDRSWDTNLCEFDVSGWIIILDVTD